jgi:hypothetical protein
MSNKPKLRTRPFTLLPTVSTYNVDIVGEFVPYYQPYRAVVCVGIDNRTHWEIREFPPRFSYDEEDSPSKFIARVDTCEGEARAIVKMMNDQFNIDIRS